MTFHEEFKKRFGDITFAKTWTLKEVQDEFRIDNRTASILLRNCMIEPDVTLMTSLGTVEMHASALGITTPGYGELLEN